jgi:hypothetical protein
MTLLRVISINGNIVEIHIKCMVKVLQLIISKFEKVKEFMKL